MSDAVNSRPTIAHRRALVSRIAMSLGKAAADAGGVVCGLDTCQRRLLWLGAECNHFGDRGPGSSEISLNGIVIDPNQSPLGSETCRSTLTSMRSTSRASSAS